MIKTSKRLDSGDKVWRGRAAREWCLLQNARANSPPQRGGGAATENDGSESVTSTQQMEAELYMTCAPRRPSAASQRNKNGVNCIYLKGSAEYLRQNPIYKIR